MKSSVTRRRFLEGAGGLAALALTDSFGPLRLLAAAPPEGAKGVADWTGFGFDMHATRFNHLEKTIGVNNVGKLKPKWKFDTVDNWVIHQTPAVVGDTLYFGAGRYEYALDRLSGKPKWQFDWGADGEWERTNWQQTLKNRGTRSSPVYDNGRIYFGTGSCAVFCLDAATGKTVWKRQLIDDARLERMEAQIFYSPVLYKDKLFIGYTGGDATIYCLDTRTGAVRWEFRIGQDAASRGTGGGSPWTSAAIDEKQNIIYNVTGSNKAFMPNLNLYTESILAHDMDTGELLWYYQARPQDAFDLDFIAHPMVFDAESPQRSRGDVRKCVAAGSKAGIYCLNRHTGELYWKVMLGGACSACGPLIDALSAAYNKVYAQWASPVGNPGMCVTAALHAYTGDIDWIQPNASQNSSPLAVANGVLYQGFVDGKFEALDANSGKKLWEFKMPSPFRGGTAVANGAVYASNGEASSWTGETLPYQHSMYCFTVDGAST